MTARDKIAGWILGRNPRLERAGMPVLISASLVLLAVRMLLAQPFWASGQTRWVQFPSEISSSTLYLFSNIFVLHFGLFEMPIPFPGLAAWVTSVCEIVLPILVVAGLFTRLGALALLAMTIVIQLVFPEAFINMTDPMNSHGLWMAYALVLAVFGGGVFSADALARRLLGMRPSMRTA